VVSWWVSSCRAHLVASAFLTNVFAAPAADIDLPDPLATRLLIDTGHFRPIVVWGMFRRCSARFRCFRLLSGCTSGLGCSLGCTCPVAGPQSSLR
jgi:hypothetical protein